MMDILNAKLFARTMPNNDAFDDDSGYPSFFVWIPKFRLCDVLNTDDESVHPAFKVNGTVIDGFWAGKYLASVHNGIAYSLPMADPAANVSWEQSYNYGKNKGAGYHMMTAAEYAAIALWCKKNGTMPYGNNNYGKDSRETTYQAMATYLDGTKTGRTAAGSGPASWYHNGNLSGIADLNGNVWERKSGTRFVYGELQILENNDAADTDNPQNTTSTCWKAINAATGELVDPECTVSGSAVLTGSTVRLDYISNKWTYSTSIANTTGAYGCAFSSVACDTTVGDSAKLLMRALAMLPDDEDTEYDNDYFYVNNAESERIVIVGGCWSSSASAGVFCSYANDSRSGANRHSGFRLAYIENL